MRLPGLVAPAEDYASASNAQTLGAAVLKRVFAYTSDGMPRSNYSVLISSKAEFSDRIGAGETNLYLLEQPQGACEL